MTTPTQNGRGAWSTNGKDNGSRTYQFISGKPLDGSSKTKGSAYYAVNLGVRAIQRALNEQGYAKPSLIVDGFYGAKTGTAVSVAQRGFGIKEDGIAGATLCSNLWRLYVGTAAGAVNLNPAILYGQMMHESSADPGACGYFHEPDRGLIQINTETYKSISIEMAHDPDFALNWSAKRLKSAWDKYAGKGADIQLFCTILQHNSPNGADTLFKTGKFGTISGQTYVQKVLEHMSEW